MRQPDTSAGQRTATDPDVRTDQELVLELVRKNRKAAAEFVSLYSDPIHAYVHQRLIPRTDLVDDMVQEVFLAAWGNLDRFEGRSSLKTWLLGIARHKIEDHYRARLREPHSLDPEEDPPPQMVDEPTFDALIDEERVLARTRQVLGELEETSRLLLLWRYWEKRSAREMAESIGRTEKAVERALARARDQFRRRWNDAGR